MSRQTWRYSHASHTTCLNNNLMVQSTTENQPITFKSNNTVILNSPRYSLHRMSPNSCLNLSQRWWSLVASTLRKRIWWIRRWFWRKVRCVRRIPSRIRILMSCVFCCVKILSSVSRRNLSLCYKVCSYRLGTMKQEVVMPWNKR